MSRIRSSGPAVPIGPGRLCFCALLLLAVQGLGCSSPSTDAASSAVSPGEAPPSTDAASPIDTDAPLPLVAVKTVEPETWFETVELTTELVPRATVTVAAEVAGRVVALPVDHGDRVAAGDPIARLDTATAEAELAQAEARLDSARVSLAQAERDLERGRSLAGENGILSTDELDRLELAAATGRASLREAEAAVALIGERLADLVIRAPFDGVISERHVEVGSWLGVGDPVMRIVDAERLEARGSASQEDRVRLAAAWSGSNSIGVRVRADALPGVDFPARLRFLGQEADARTGTYLVEAEVMATAEASGEGASEGSGQSARLLAGMRGSMVLTLAEHSDLLVPRTALVETVDGMALFVVEENGSNATVRRLAVETETIGPRRVRVRSGLEPGSTVVVQGQYRLADGDAVEIRREEAVIEGGGEAP